MPDLELADDLKKTVCLRSGGTLRLLVFVTGRPTPVVAWRKTGVELQNRGYIETTDSYTCLMVEKVSRYDSGKYVVEAENPSGKKTATILVKVYGITTIYNRYGIPGDKLYKSKPVSSCALFCRHSWSSRFCKGKRLHQGICCDYMGRPKC